MLMAFIVNPHSEGYDTCHMFVCLSVCYHSSGDMAQFYTQTEV